MIPGIQATKLTTSAIKTNNATNTPVLVAGICFGSLFEYFFTSIKCDYLLQYFNINDCVGFLNDQHK